jgi:integrase
MNAFDDAGLIRSSALRVLLLTGQRGGEVRFMRKEHIKDGWWEMPGKPDPAARWPGTKNGLSHRVWLSQPVRQIIAEVTGDDNDSGFVFATERGAPVRGLDQAMRDLSKKLGVEPAKPHDLRRTFGSSVTRLGHGRPAMDRLLNHSDRSTISAVYDRFSYEAEDRRIWDHVGEYIISLAEGRMTGTVVRGRF